MHRKLSAHEARKIAKRKVNKREYIEAFILGYVDCAKWCGIYPEEPDREDAKELEITRKSLREMRKECRCFVRDNWADLLTDLAEGRNAEAHGHDFWLTRNREGAGFWENPGEHNQRLSDAAKVYGGSMLSVYRGKLHVSST